MRHLFIAESDYAAAGKAFSLAMQAVGKEAHSFTCRHHLYRYPEQGEILPQDISVIETLIDWADWIWVVQTDLPIIMGGTYGEVSLTEARMRWIERMHGKKIGLLHGGGHFRDHRDLYQSVWQEAATISICFEADLMGSFENEWLVIPPINLRWFEKSDAPCAPRLRIGHFPSRPTDKGSELIIPAMQEIEGIDFVTSVTDPYEEEGCVRVPWIEQLARMAQCDVIIDQIKPTLGKFLFGEWVSIATEAAALGRISVANSQNVDPYRRTYGRDPEIKICNTIESLIEEIERLKSLSKDALREEQRETRNWIEQYHALKPTGQLMQRLCA